MPGTSTPPRHRKGRMVLAGVATLGALSLSLTACGGGSTGAAASKTQTLTVLVHQNPPSNKAWSDLGADFEKANPGIKVNFSFIPTENFAKVRNARLTAGEVDITEGSSSGGTRPTPDFAQGVVDSDWVRSLKANQWVQLSGDFLSNWSPGVRKAMQWQGKDYSVPTAISYVNGVYYNKDLFTKYNVQVPRTWDDFLKAMDTFKADGVTPITMGGVEKWTVGLVMEGIADGSIKDMDALNQGLWTGNAKFTDAEQLQVLQKIQKVYSYAPKTFPGTADAVASSSFANGKAAMFPEGSWQAPGISQANPKLNFGYFPFPGGNDASQNVLRGKLESSLAIPTSSKHQDAAKKLLAFYSQPAEYQKWVTTAGAVPVQPNIKVTPFLDSLVQFEAPGGYAASWGEHFTPNPAAPKSVRVGFPYDQIAPMGTQTDMAALAATNQKAWNEALPKH